MAVAKAGQTAERLRRSRQQQAPLSHPTSRSTSARDSDIGTSAQLGNDPVQRASVGWAEIASTPVISKLKPAPCSQGTMPALRRWDPSYTVTPFAPLQARQAGEICRTMYASAFRSLAELPDNSAARSVPKALPRSPGDRRPGPRHAHDPLNKPVGATGAPPRASVQETTRAGGDSPADIFSGAAQRCPTTHAVWAFSQLADPRKPYWDCCARARPGR